MSTLAQTISITKRNGDKESIDLNKIHTVVNYACNGINGVSASEVELQSQLQFYNGMKSSDIQEILIKAAAELISEESPNYQYVAGRLINYQVRKNVFGQYEPLPLVEHVGKVIAAGHQVVEHDEPAGIDAPERLHHQHGNGCQQHQQQQGAHGAAYAQRAGLGCLDVAAGHGHRTHAALADLHPDEEKGERHDERDVRDVGEEDLHDPVAPLLPDGLPVPHRRVVERRAGERDVEVDQEDHLSDHQHRQEDQRDAGEVEVGVGQARPATRCALKALQHLTHHPAVPADQGAPQVQGSEALVEVRAPSELGQERVHGAEDQEPHVEEGHVVEVAHHPQRVVQGVLERRRGVDDPLQPRDQP